MLGSECKKGKFCNFLAHFFTSPRKADQNVQNFRQSGVGRTLLSDKSQGPRMLVSENSAEDPDPTLILS